MSAKSKSGLTLPPRSEKRATDREISPDAIEEWRNSLPLNDLTTSAKALYLTLKDIYAEDVHYKTRLELLSLLRPTLSFIAQSLQKLYENREVLTEEQRLIAELVNSLYLEMVNGYKLVIEDTAGSIFFGKKALLCALQNALHYCTKILFHSYEQHTTPMPGIWHELHALFEFIQRKGLANKSLKNAVEWKSRLKTLGDIYKHCLLLAVSNPHRLRREQMIHYQYALEAWAPLLGLVDVSDKSSPLFIIDIHSDAPPRYAILYSQYGDDCYALKMDKINRRLGKLMAALKAPNKEKAQSGFTSLELELDPGFIKSFISMWQTMSDRTHERKSLHGHINVSLGISASHWFIQQMGSNTTAVNFVPEEDEEIIDMTILPSDRQSMESKYQLYICELIDRSEAGFCLKWMQEIPVQLQCGEIMAVQTQDENKPWAIGTIRWLKREEDRTLLMGIQLLSTDAIAVKARFSDAATTQHSVPALILPEREDGKPMTLVTHPLPFKKGHEVDLEFDAKVYQVILQQSFSLSPSYQEFGLEFLGHPLVFPMRGVAEEAFAAAKPE